MQTTSTQEILKSHKLRITSCRQDVLKRFLGSERALSLGVLENEFPNYDRVTLYRTLNSFLESGILHKIPNEQGMATYGLCPDSCGPEAHHHEHMHFKCNNCGRLECIEGIRIPKIDVPDGYKLEQVNVIADGICANCA